VCRPENSFTESLDLGKDRIRGSRPNQEPDVLVVVLHEFVDLGRQFLHTAESPAADRSLGDALPPDLRLTYATHQHSRVNLWRPQRVL